MISFDLFFNRAGRLRSGWRLAIFVVAYLILLSVASGVLWFALYVALGQSSVAVTELLSGYWGFLAQALILFVTATVVGWGCGYVLEDLPWRALGWTLHRGWRRDFIVGALLGGASLLLAALIASAAGGGFHYEFNGGAGFWPAVLKTLSASALIFTIAAAAEEALFRGYPLQTMLRALPHWVAIIPSSILFAYVHLSNPNVVPGFTLINTLLAGVWLAVAYLRTRSLWFPLGVHWAWNWVMGAVLGLPVSGITQLTPAPLFEASDAGPAWLTGGAYGIEGGAACTLALILSTLFIWRTPLLKATDELKRWTDSEIPAPTTQPLSIRDFPTDVNQPPVPDEKLAADR